MNPFIDNLNKMVLLSIKAHMSYHLRCVIRKTDFCLCENKGADQLCSNCTADSTIPQLSKFKISSL